MDLQERTAYSDELILTKLALPRPRSRCLARTALLNRLDQGLQSRLTLISAGAGFGKSTLAAEWIHRLQERENRPTIAWISLDPGDNDPLRFWRYLLTGIQSQDRLAVDRALAHLEESHGPPFEAILSTLINALEKTASQQLIVVEDYHAINNPAIHADVAFLLDHLPAAIHLVILTRSDPPLPLAYLRARNEINELRAADLRFSEDETRAFLQQAQTHPLFPEAAERLFARTEGWPAGLHLAAVALQGRPDPRMQETFLATFTGSHRPILEYLVDDVFAAQSEPLQNFLLETSFFSRLCGALCDAVTGGKDGAEKLDQLTRANLFLEPLDGSGMWYRYHALFAEAMQHIARQRLGEHRLQRIAEAASQWYEVQAHSSNNQPDAFLYEAVETALFARAFDRATRLIERCVKPRLAGNEYHTLLRWFEQLPASVLAAHPALAMVYAQALLFSAHFVTPELAERIRQPLATAEQAWSDAGKDAKIGEILAFRALMAARRGDYPESFALARTALAKLPERGGLPSEIEWRAVSLNLVGWDDYLAGRLNVALPALITARGLFQTVHNLYGILDATHALGEIYAGRAEARQARGFFQQVLAESEAAPLAHSERVRRQGRALIGLAKLAYEQNQLEEAEQLANQALDLGGEINGEDLIVSSSLMLARAAWARGDEAAARARLTELVTRVTRPHLAREVQAWLGWMALAAGETAAAHRWPAAAYELAESTPFFVRERETLVAARGLLMSGEAGTALGHLQAGLTEAKAQGRLRSELDLLVLMAGVLAIMDRRSEAADRLRRALRLAYSEGYQRPFLDEAEGLAAIWNEAVSGLEEPVASWAQSLGMPAGKSPVTGKPARLSSSSGLGEALSGQEERVLRLIGEGLSNEEIAQALVVSINTVKTHVKSIYRKLQVNNRRAARQAARQLPPRP